MKLENGTKIVFAGDGNLAAREGFTFLLALFAKRSGHDWGRLLMTAPFPGAFIADYSRRFELEVYPKQPDIVVLIPGIADVLFCKTGDLTEPVAHFKSLLDELIGVLGPSRLVVCSTLMLAEDPEYSKNKLAARYNDELERICLRREVEYIDLFSPLCRSASLVEAHRLTTDGTSLSAVGHFIVFDTFSQFFGLIKSADSANNAM